VSDISLDHLMRKAVELAATMAPSPRMRVAERWARGFEESRKLHRSDLVVVSYGKSGRTWLNVMLSRYFQLRFGLPEYSMFSFNNLHEMDRTIPTVQFTHDNYLRDYTGSGASKTAFYRKPTLLLARHPADVAVSLFFQWRYRMPAHKKQLNGYPPHGAEISVFDFVMHDSGLRDVVRFLNEWAGEFPQLENGLMVRYEDMRRDAKKELDRMLRWMGQEPTEAEIAGAVEFASFENLKALEARKAFSKNTKRLAPGQADNPDSFKVRRAKVGGYRDYFDDEQVRQIETYICDNLDPLFGYETATREAATKVGATS
jgi:hypothetical protein